MNKPNFDPNLDFSHSLEDELVTHLRAVTILKKLGSVTREQLEKEIFRLKLMGENFDEGRVRFLYNVEKDRETEREHDDYVTRFLDKVKAEDDGLR